MAEIQDQAAIEFVDVWLRPLCQLVQSMKLRADVLELRWFDGISAAIPNDPAATISREGQPTLTGADINNIVSNLLAARDQVILDVIGKACVLPPQIS